MAQAQPFVWGGNGEQLSYTQAKKRREVADALASKSAAPTTFGAGLSRIGEALLAKSYGDQATAAETAGADSRKAVMDALMGNPDPTMADISGALGNEWVASDPGSSAIAQALLGQELDQNDPLRQQQLQMGQIELENARNPQPEPGFSIVTPEEVTAMGLPPGSYQRGPDQKLYELGGGGQTINVGGNNDIGTIPPGKMVTRDGAGNVTGMVDIPGGPSEAEAIAAAEKAANAEGIATTSNDIVATDIDRALAIIDTPGLLPTTGFGADWFNNVGGTAGNDLRNLLNTVKANTAFGTLQAMREASPTGGALGAVTAPELTLLEAAKGAVEQSQSPQQLKDNLIRLQNISLDIVHGKGNGPERKVPSFEQSQPTPGVTPSIDELIQKYGTPQ